MFLKEVMRKVSFKKYIMLSVYKYLYYWVMEECSKFGEHRMRVRVVQGIAKSNCRFFRLGRSSNPKISENWFLETWRKYKCKWQKSEFKKCNQHVIVDMGWHVPMYRISTVCHNYVVKLLVLKILQFFLVMPIVHLCMLTMCPVK